MNTKIQKSNRPDGVNAEFLIARYTALREEMQNRNSYAYQMISINLTISAAILTYGLQPSAAASAFFIIPIISMLIGTVVVHNWMAGRRLAISIKNDIEAEFNFFSNVHASQKHLLPGFLGMVGTGGIFVAVEVLAVVLGLILVRHYTTLDIVLITCDILSVLISLWLTGVTVRVRTNEESPAQKAG